MIDCASLAFSANVADKSLQVCVSHPLSHAMPYPTHLPQTEYDEKKPACREEAHSGLAQGQTSLIEEHHGISKRLGWDAIPMQKNAVCIARSSWCGMQGFVVVPRFDLESCGSCGMINLWMLAWWPEGIALVLTLELGPWVDQELPGTKNKLRNATVLVIVDQLSFPSTFLQHGEDMKS